MKILILALCFTYVSGTSQDYQDYLNWYYSRVRGYTRFQWITQNWLKEDTGPRSAYIYKGTLYVGPGRPHRINLRDFADLARYGDPNMFPDIAEPRHVIEPNVPSTVAKTATVDPNDWTLEQKALYLQIMMMLGE